MSERETLVATMTDYVERYEDARVWAANPAEAAKYLADMAERYANEKLAAELEQLLANDNGLPYDQWVELVVVKARQRLTKLRRGEPQ